jgi:predicted RNA polymerase sigma factor
MVDGPEAGLTLLEDLDQQLDGHHRLHAVRAQLLEMSGEREAAIAEYRLAAERTNSLPEQRYLTRQAAQLNERRG